MSIEVTEKLVSVVDGSIIGYLVSAGGQYKVPVTQAFGVANSVQDIEIADFFDIPVVNVVPVGRRQYAVQENNIGFMEDLVETPSEEIGDNKVYYGYIFKSQHIVPMDSEYAFKRMVDEASGSVVE